MAAIHITDIEAAINFWRERKPSPDGITLAPELRALAEVYALMVYPPRGRGRRSRLSRRRPGRPGWPGTTATPDTPCIAICSTSQGDDECKGCGRSFDEVQHWPAMTPGREARDLAPHHAWRTRPGASTAMPSGRARREPASAATTPPAARLPQRRRRRSREPAMRRLAQAPNLRSPRCGCTRCAKTASAPPCSASTSARAAGQLPPDQCLPEIWIEDDAQFDAGASALLHDLQHRPQRRWHCACGELVEGGFEQCWQCGAMMPGAEPRPAATSSAAARCRRCACRRPASARLPGPSPAAACCAAASAASACEAAVGMRQTLQVAAGACSLFSMPRHQISAAWLKQ